MRLRNRTWPRLLAALAVVVFITAIPSAQARLKVGDPAPKFQPGKWIQGGPVSQFEPGKVYIVEFWATWCGPCRVSTPHLNELALKFQARGLVVIGQDVWENDEEAVAPFVKGMGSKMTYRVATDNKTEEKEGAMAATWMKAAGQGGIPTAFVIEKKGRVAWIGHPMELNDKLISDLLADRYDLAKAAAEYEENARNQQVLTELSQKLDQSVRQKEWDAALANLDHMEKLAPSSERDALSMARFQVLLLKKDLPAAYKLAGAMSDSHLDDAQTQNLLAWAIATMEGLDKRDLTLAEKMAGRADKASNGKDPNVLDTLARVQFMNGKKSQAVATEKRAVELAEGKDKEGFAKSLELYKQGKLPEIHP